MDCKHDFDIIDKTVLLSAFEQCQSALGSAISGGINVKSPKYFTKKVIILMKCNKCKELKEIVETNP